jgi:flagellar biogenesis protein FliO
MDGRDGQVRVRCGGIQLWILAAIAVIAGFALAWPEAARAQAMATVQVEGNGTPGAAAVKADVPMKGATAVPTTTRAAETNATAPAASRSALEATPIRGGTAAGTNVPGDSGDKKAPEGGLTKGLMSLVQVGGALAVVIGLIYIGRALVRKFVPGAAAGHGEGVIEILARHPLAKGQALVLVRIGSQIVVLNQGRETSQSVLVVSDAEEVANILGQLQGAKPTSSQAGFNRLLANARMDLEQGEDAEEGEDRPVAVANKPVEAASMEEELEEMAAARRQLMDLREQVRAVGQRIR